MTDNQEGATMEFGTDKLRRAWSSIESNPYDMESWSLIIRDAQNRNIEESRTIFEKLVDTFATTGKFWKMYIEQEMRAYNFERVEKVCSYLYQSNKRFLMGVFYSMSWQEEYVR